MQVAYMEKHTGLWLAVSERHTHTGKHVDTRFVQDINQAYVGPPLNTLMAPKVTLDLSEFKVLEAEVEVIRKVRLV